MNRKQKIKRSFIKCKNIFLNSEKHLKSTYTTFCENWKKYPFLSSTIALIFLIALFYPTATFFFEETGKNAMGELLKVVLTVIVAICGLYALRLNANRIKVMSKGNTDTRFNNAVTQLGSENEAVALGGVYALHEIARENEYTYLNVVHDILCGYIRSESVARYKKHEKENTNEELAPSIVIQTIIDLLFPHRDAEEFLYRNLRSHLYNSILIRYNFYGSIINYGNFNGSKIIDCGLDETIIRNTFFVSAKIECCRLEDAKISHSQFLGVKIDDKCNFNRIQINNSNFHNTQIHDEHKIWEIIKKNKSNILDRFVEDLRNPNEE